MALSQKHTGKSLVPWFCSAEWHNVYKKLYGEESDDYSKRLALDILKIWKARVPLLPCGVEGTFIILEAMFIDRTTQDDYNMRLLLSSALMRFLNICAAYNKFQGTFFATARRMNLPDWLINLRHDAAHSQSLPSLDVLDYGLKFSFHWLYREYWQPHSSKIEDFIDSTNTNESDIAELFENLEPFLYNYCYLNLVLHPYWSYKTINDIQVEHSKRVLIKELNQALNCDIDQNTSIRKVLNLLWKHIEHILIDFENNAKFGCFVELLLKDDVFLGNFEDNEQIFHEIYPNEFPRKFVFLWNQLLENMHKLGMLESLIQGLLKILSKPAETRKKKWNASLWLAEIGKGLSKCVLAKNIREDFTQDEIKNLSDKQLRKLLKERCEQNSPEMKNVLDLSYLSPEPDILMSVAKLKTEILNEPNEFTHLFIPHLLRVNDTLKCDSTVEQITELVKTYTTSEDDAFYFSRTFTLEDINEAMDVGEEGKKDDDVVGKLREEMFDNHGMLTDPSSASIWEKVTDINFERCPIGILPFQSSKMNPLLLQ